MTASITDLPYVPDPLGSNLNNNLPQIIRNPKISNRIHFAHLRNMKFDSDGVFYESSHLSS